MAQESLPEWETSFVDDVIARAEARLEDERSRARKRAMQLAREQAYHRLAIAIDRPERRDVSPGQLSFLPSTPTLFDDPA